MKRGREGERYEEEGAREKAYRNSLELANGRITLSPPLEARSSRTSGTMAYPPKTVVSLFLSMLLVLYFASIVAAHEPHIPGEEDSTPDIDLAPGSFGIYIAELFGTIAGLIWGLYASLPSFG